MKIVEHKIGKYHFCHISAFSLFTDMIAIEIVGLCLAPFVSHYNPRWVWHRLITPLRKCPILFTRTLNFFVEFSFICASIIGNWIFFFFFAVEEHSLHIVVAPYKKITQLVIMIMEMYVFKGWKLRWSPFGGIILWKNKGAIVASLVKKIYTALRIGAN